MWLIWVEKPYEQKKRTVILFLNEFCHPDLPRAFQQFVLDHVVLFCTVFHQLGRLQRDDHDPHPQCIHLPASKSLQKECMQKLIPLMNEAEH